MKLKNLPILIISIIVVIWLLFNLEIWAKEWKDLFFYQDNWIFYIFLAIMAFAIGMIIKKLFVLEYKVLK